MKKNLTIIVLAMCLLLVMPFIVACQPPTPKDEIKYTGSTLADGPVGLQYTASVATATGVSSITYALKDGNNLPAGLSLSSAGAISGRPTAETNGVLKFKVVASASGVDSVEAEFSMKITGLKVKEKNIQSNVESSSFGAQLEIDNMLEGVTISYALKSGSQPLPGGITLGSDGYLSGIPTQQVLDYKCTVVASAPGFTSGEGIITFYILAKVIVGDTGEIKGFATRALSDAYINETYPSNVSVKGNAAADNDAPVSFVLETEGTLPAGFTLQQNGDLRCTGVINAVAKSYTFVVIAKAEKCPDVKATFTLVVNLERLVCPAIEIDQGTLGTQYNTSMIKSSLTTKYPGVSFAFSSVQNYAPPAGLTVNSNGMLTGTPTKSVRDHKFRVEVSAAGYSSGLMEVKIRVRDPIEAVTDGIFQAELIDMDGLVGAGQSNNPTDIGMIQRGKDENITTANGYFIGYTNAKNIFVFEIYSSIAVSNVRMALSLASENGNLTFNNNGFIIRVNGAPLTYSAFTVNGTKAPNSPFSVFQDYNISTAFSLIAGKNIIELDVTAVYLDANSNGGPAINYLKLTNYGTSALSWAPCKYNYDQPERWSD